MQSFGPTNSTRQTSTPSPQIELEAVALRFLASGSCVHTEPFSPPERQVIDAFFALSAADVDMTLNFSFHDPGDSHRFTVEGYKELRTAHGFADPATLDSFLSVGNKIAKLVHRISGAKNLNLFVVTNSAEPADLSWHRHEQSQIYAVLTLHADGSGTGGSMFAPSCTAKFSPTRPPSDEILGPITRTQPWDLSVFRGDTLHSSPDFTGRRTLLRVCSL